ncbi:MAG: DUF3857 domain-containing protein [Terriglobales bacterium]
MRTIRRATRGALLMVIIAALSAAAEQVAAGRPGAAPTNATTELFVNSALESARKLATAELRRRPRDTGALFVQMEVAALEADIAGELEAALRLCESGPHSNDPRAMIAAARILDLAGNNVPFRTAIPRIQRLLAADSVQQNFLRAALVAAAADGAPGLSTLELAHQSGLITDWRVAGPFGEFPNVAFDRHFAPERDSVAGKQYDGRAVENFRFDDGNFALAPYFSQDGIFYAAADVPVTVAGEFRVRLESAGTVEVFVDGASVLRKDDRFRATPEIAWAPVRLGAGKHRVLLKFLPSATPLRVAVQPMSKFTVSPAPSLSEPEATYVRAAEKYWLGDYDGAIAELASLRARHPSAAATFLLARAWAHAGGSPEEAALLESTLQLAPGALAAEYELAARAFNSNHFEEALRRVQRIVSTRPDFVPAQALRAQAAARLKWDSEVRAAMEAELRLAPTCATLRRALTFFGANLAFERARQVEARLNGCAPGSLAYAEALSQSGRHLAAAAAADKVVSERPLDRAAREFFVRELAMAGRRDEATRAAVELAALAPNAASFRKLAEDAAAGAQVFDRASSRTRDFAAVTDFYSRFRRDGVEMIRATEHRRFSGGPAVTILDDRVARVAADGSVSFYVHKVTRVLNRDGIERYGEVTAPPSSDLLELRTIKQDGTIAEPEFNQHKNSISMPALAPGDAIELEYVVRYTDGIERHADMFTYTFGSFTAPILYARFVVLSPEEPEMLEIAGVNGAPAPQVDTADGVTTRVWEQENILQSTEETGTPRADILPTVRVTALQNGGWPKVRDFYRNTIIEAVRAGTHVESMAAELRGATDDETGRNMYLMVTSRVHSTECAFETGAVASAEATLSAYSGCRTAALLALARAAGLQAGLLLARTIEQPRPRAPQKGAYTHPLVLFRLGQGPAAHEVVVDAESDGLGFGVLPATIAHEDALAVPLDEPATAKAEIVSVPASAGDEHSVADGDITIDDSGNLTAKLTITMGAARSAEMRNILRGIAPGERGRFFEQLAMRIFPGASEASGEVRNENDWQHPLELRLACQAPRFVAFSGTSIEMEQLAPALGLRKMYGLGPRRFPLYIQTPLIETTIFRVRIPAGYRLSGQPPALEANSQFGAYTVRGTVTGENEFEIRRAFRIPVQIIPPDRFDEFARFARQIDEAERQRITLVSGQYSVLSSQ